MVDCICGFFASPLWTAPTCTFIDNNCVAFDGEEENKLVYTEIHIKFRELVEGLSAPTAAALPAAAGRHCAAAAWRCFWRTCS